MFINSALIHTLYQRLKKDFLTQGTSCIYMCFQYFFVLQRLAEGNYLINFSDPTVNAIK